MGSSWPWFSPNWINLVSLLTTHSHLEARRHVLTPTADAPAVWDCVLRASGCDLLCWIGSWLLLTRRQKTWIWMICCDVHLSSHGVCSLDSYSVCDTFMQTLLRQAWRSRAEGLHTMHTVKNIQYQYHYYNIKVIYIYWHVLCRERI